MMKWSRMECLGEDICNLVLCGNWKEMDQARLDLIDHVAVHLNMFGSLMEDKIGGNVHSWDIVIKDREWLRNINHEILQEK